MVAASPLQTEVHRVSEAIAVIQANYEHLSKQVSEVKKEMAELNESVVNLRMQNVKWNLVAGAGTAMIIKLIEHAWK